VVGFDGSPASQDAVRWAAAEASRCRLPLTLVHAGYYLYEPALSEATARIAAGEIAQYASTVTEQALAIARELDPVLDINSEIHPEQAAKALLKLGASAEMLVLGTHGEGSIAGAILGSISQTVAAHAHCPVIVVNHDRPRNAEPRKAVVVGVSPTPGGQQALRFAFEQASLRGCELEAVRSWGDLGWGAVALSDSGTVIHDWQATESKMLDECLDAISPDYPGVTVHRTLTGVRSQWALQAAAIGAELLVVGCHRPDDHWFSRLGPVASWLLHRSACPIAVVGRAQVAKQPAEEVAGHAGYALAEAPLILW
jgi:nucleotide-binding universal stress UspA family protein